MIFPHARQFAALALIFAACMPAASAQSDTAFVVVHGIAGRDVVGSLDPAMPVDVSPAG